MGAWGSGPFENDDALDYVGELLDAAEGEGDEDAPGKVSHIVGALTLVAQPDLADEDDEGGDYLEAPEASCAVVAAEIIAAIHGKPGPDMRTVQANNKTLRALVKWIKTKASKDPMLTRAQVKDVALQAVNRVREDSELADLWAEAKEEAAESWAASMDDLAKRLR